MMHLDEKFGECFVRPFTYLVADQRTSWIEMVRKSSGTQVFNIIYNMVVKLASDFYLNIYHLAIVIFDFITKKYFVTEHMKF